jgi:hypothetical protein
MARKTVIKSSAVKEDTLEDADGDTKIQVEESSDEDKIRFDVDGSEKMILDGTGLGIGTTTPDYTLDVAGNIGLNEYIYHNGDADTYIQFGDDQMILRAGGRSMLKLEEAGTDKLIVNHGALDIDFQVKGENAANLIRTDAEIDTVGINTANPKCNLSVAGSLAFNVTAIGSSNDPGTTYTVVATDCVILVNTRPTAQGGIDSALTITMPGVSDYPGRVVTIKDAGGYSQTNAITIQGAGSDNFEGNPSTTSIQFSSNADAFRLISDGSSSWYKI